MADNYSQASTMVDAAKIQNLDKILKAWKILTERDNPELAYDIGADGGLRLEAKDEGHLWITSSDEWFNSELFVAFIRTCIKNKWITGSVDISVSYFCDELLCNEFGGFYIRVLADGGCICIDTEDFRNVPDYHLAKYEVRPRQFPS